MYYLTILLQIPKHLAKIVPEGPSGTPEVPIGSSGTVCTRPRRNLRQPSSVPSQETPTHAHGVDARHS